MMKIVLLSPEIPPNTGNISRLCVACDVELHLVKPLGFSLADRHLRRAGLDYWNLLKLTVHESFDDFIAVAQAPCYFFSSKGKEPYTSIAFQGNEFLVFGAETRGFPPSVFDKYADHIYRIPMFGPVRCLNLSNAVAVVVYEALRQTRLF